MIGHHGREFMDSRMHALRSCLRSMRASSVERRVLYCIERALPRTKRRFAMTCLPDLVTCAKEHCRELKGHFAAAWLGKLTPLPLLLGPQLATRCAVRKHHSDPEFNVDRCIESSRAPAKILPRRCRGKQSWRAPQRPTRPHLHPPQRRSARAIPHRPTTHPTYQC